MKKNAKQNGAGNPTGAFLLIALGEIELSPTNTRQIDDKSLADLAASIRQNGVLQPILVRPVEAEKAKYQIVAGERRFRAAGLADAEAQKARGLAEAAVIEAQGSAQAEAMLRKAESFKQYNEAAVIELIVRVLPDLAGRISEPLSKTDKITIIRDGGTVETLDVTF